MRYRLIYSQLCISIDLLFNNLFLKMASVAQKVVECLIQKVTRKQLAFLSPDHYLIEISFVAFVCTFDFGSSSFRIPSWYDAEMESSFMLSGRRKLRVKEL